jgi:hypothetical protein
MKNSARDTLALQHVLLLLATRMEGETPASRAPAVTGIPKTAVGGTEK